LLLRVLGRGGALPKAAPPAVCARLGSFAAALRGLSSGLASSFRLGSWGLAALAFCLVLALGRWGCRLPPPWFLGGRSSVPVGLCRLCCWLPFPGRTLGLWWCRCRLIILRVARCFDALLDVCGGLDRRSRRLSGPGAGMYSRSILPRLLCRLRSCGGGSRNLICRNRCSWLGREDRSTRCGGW
jgi:hypothetical protein